MKIIVPSLCITIIIIGAMLYWSSPAHQVSELRSENAALRESLAMAQKNSEISDVAAIMMMGTVAILGMCFVFFFLMLCMMSGRRPAEFFTGSAVSHDQYRCLQGQGRNHEIRQIPAESYREQECLPDYSYDWRL